MLWWQPNWPESGGERKAYIGTLYEYTRGKKMNKNELTQLGFEEDTIMCQDCKDAVASHRGRHYDTELCADCFYERYD